MPNHAIRLREGHVSADFFEQDLEILKEESEAAKLNSEMRLGVVSSLFSGAQDRVRRFCRRVMACEWIAADEPSRCDTLHRKMADRTEPDSATMTADHRADDPAASLRGSIL
jgi:hypothetical protein